MKKLFPIFLVVLAGCSAIFEKNIEKLQVVLIAPKDSLVTTNFTNLFYWDEVEDALNYELQIAEPGFDNPVRVLLDTNVQSTSYEFTLSPGSYQWRVKAYNGSSETAYSVFTLTIDSNPDLSSQQVNLLSPGSVHYTADTTIAFSWQGMPLAENYQFEIRTPDFNGSLVGEATTTSDTSITKTLAEGNYAWGVRAQNALSNTLFFSRSVTIDQTNPAVPSPTSPVDNDTLSTGTAITFQWGSGQDGGSPITDSLLIGTSATDWSAATGYASATLSQTLDSLQAGTYYWKVYATDAAGNSSADSPTHQLTIE